MSLGYFLFSLFFFKYFIIIFSILWSDNSWISITSDLTSIWGTINSPLIKPSNFYFYSLFSFFRNSTSDFKISIFFNRSDIIVVFSFNRSSGDFTALFTEILGLLFQ